jgi:hypothetical protein
MAYNNDTKPSASYTNDGKPSSTVINDSKPASEDCFLLKEDFFNLLLETGDKIVLKYGLDYTFDSKPA